MPGFCVHCMACPVVACSAPFAAYVTQFRCGFGCSTAGTQVQHTQWMHKDVCGVFTATMSQWLIMGAIYIVNVHVLDPWMGYSTIGLAHRALFTGLLAMGALSHWRAMTTDPGTVPPNAMPLAGQLQEDMEKGSPPRKCRRSGIYKPPRAHYDSEIRRVVMHMDHHCPWVNNCVGMANHKYFVLFCAYVFLGSLYALALLVVRSIQCGLFKKARTFQPPEWCDDKSSTGGVAFLMRILLLIESCLFGLFTLVMFFETVCSLMSGETYIDQLQSRHQKKAAKTRTSFQNLQQVFGNNALWQWALPVAPWWRDQDERYPYQIPESDEQWEGFKSSYLAAHARKPLDPAVVLRWAPETTPRQSSEPTPTTKHRVPIPVKEVGGPRQSEEVAPLLAEGRPNVMDDPIPTTTATMDRNATRSDIELAIMEGIKSAETELLGSNSHTAAR